MKGYLHFVTWKKEGMDVDFEVDEEQEVLTVGEFYLSDIQGLNQDQIRLIEERMKEGYYPEFRFQPADTGVTLL